MSDTKISALTSLGSLPNDSDVIPIVNSSTTKKVTRQTFLGVTGTLGTMSTQNSNNVTITGGAITGITDIAIADGGTGQSTKAAGFDALSPMTTSGDIIYGGTSGTGTRLAKGSDGTVLTLASGVPSWAASGSGPVTKLTPSASSGSSTTTTANNLATVAISGLGIADQLEVVITLDAVTQAGGTVQLYSSTDSAIIMELMAGGSSLTVDCDYHGTANIMQNPRTNLTYLTNVMEFSGATGTGSGQAAGGIRSGTHTVSTAWTGNWTLALKSGGVTSGGTLKWSWAIYKKAG